MKKIIFALLVLLVAGPVIAAESVVITITPRSNNDGDCNGWSDISYTATDCDVRAFALNIEATGDAANEKITDIADYKKGESNSVSKGYGIFPDANTGVDIVNGVVQSWGSPIAGSGSPGASGTGLGTSKIIIEMGSLYYGDANRPSRTGKLCRVKVNKTCRLSATAETTYRGGVVKESGVAITPVITAPGNGFVYTFPTNHPHYGQWVSTSKKKCWCYLRQCRGDTNNTAETKSNYWVYSGDLTTMLAAWGKGIGSMSGSMICADFAHNAETKSNYRVYSSDLTILLSNWGKTAGPSPDCFDSQ